MTQEAVSTPQAVAFLLRTSQGEFTPDQFKVVRVDTAGSDAEAARLNAFLTSEKLDVVVHYELRQQDHFLHKWLEVTNKSGADLVLRDVTLSSLGLPHPVDLMAGQELTYPITRLQKGGFFSCLETVYWDHRGDRLTYYPGAALPSGKTLETEKSVVGVYQNTGDVVMGWDCGVRDWVTEYHVHISPPPQHLARRLLRGVVRQSRPDGIPGAAAMDRACDGDRPAAGHPLHGRLRGGPSDG